MTTSGWITRLTACLMLCACLTTAVTVLVGTAPVVAQDATAEQAAAPETELLTADEVRELVAPVALYPDELLAVVLPASTNPLQVVQAQRYLEKRQADQTLQPDAEWDPSILALLNYPDVVAKLNDDLEWTENLGVAVIDQQGDVMDAIQQIRAEANAAGYLKSNEQQVVVQEKETIVIQSADPEVVYVPTYDPQVVVVQSYAAPPPVVYSDPYPYYYSPAATFWTGAVVGATFAYAFDWADNDIDIDVGDNCCGRGDINITTGDINIGSGNVNIDSDRFKADKQRTGTQDKLTWSGQKAKTAQTKTRAKQSSAATSASSLTKKKTQAGAGQASTAKAKSKQRAGQQPAKAGSAGGLGTYESRQKAKNAQNRGSQSLSGSSTKKKATQGASAAKSKQSTGAFGGYGNGKTVGTQSKRGNASGQKVRKRR
jgi:Protein of unknown function (DUF3300)